MKQYKTFNEAFDALQLIQDSEERAARKAKGKAKYLRRINKNRK